MNTQQLTRLEQIKRISANTHFNNAPKLENIPVALHGVISFLRKNTSDIHHVSHKNTHCITAYYSPIQNQPTAIEVLKQLDNKKYKAVRFQHNPTKQYVSFTLVKIS